MHPFKQATDMDPNTRFLNSGMSSDPQDPNAQHYQNFHLPQYSLQLSTPKSTPKDYHGGLYQGNMGQLPARDAWLPGGFASNGPASPVGPMAFFGASGGSSSWGDESSPIASASQAGGAPMHPAPVVQIILPSRGSCCPCSSWIKSQRLCLVSKFLSPNFTIYLSHQISCLMHEALNIGK